MSWHLFILWTDLGFFGAKVSGLLRLSLELGRLGLLDDFRFKVGYLLIGNLALPFCFRWRLLTYRVFLLMDWFVFNQVQLYFPVCDGGAVQGFDGLERLGALGHFDKAVAFAFIGRSVVDELYGQYFSIDGQQLGNVQLGEVWGEASDEKFGHSCVFWVAVQKRCQNLPKWFYRILFDEMSTQGFKMELDRMVEKFFELANGGCCRGLVTGFELSGLQLFKGAFPFFVVEGYRAFILRCVFIKKKSADKQIQMERGGWGSFIKKRNR